MTIPRSTWWVAAASFMIALLVVAVVLPLWSSVAPSQADTSKRLQVVYHINFDQAALHLNALRSLQHHLDNAGTDGLDVRVLLHGNGIHLLKHAFHDPDLRSAVDILRMQDVPFLVCDNTMEARGLGAEDLYDLKPGDRVPSGLGELARLQRAGFTYIKP